QMPLTKQAIYRMQERFSFFQAEDGIRDFHVTGVQTCALPILVRVPTVEAEDRRQLHRELRTLKQERIRVANRMNGLLANQGLWRSEERRVGKEWGYRWVA